MLWVSGTNAISAAVARNIAASAIMPVLHEFTHSARMIGP
jgi:hypothetical protein